MKKKGLILSGFVMFMALLFSACEKDLNITLPTGNAQLVVEGAIETDSLPYVILTNSIGFFDKLTIQNLKFEKNASITVTDLTTNFSTKLYPFAFPLGNGNDSLYIYYPNFLDPKVDSIRGKVDHYYKLKIENNGKIYEAVTKIPNQVMPDSIWAVKENKDSSQTAYVKYSDPDTIGNFTKYKTQVKRFTKNQNLPEGFLTSFNSIFDDAVTNGTTLPFSIDLGHDKNVNFDDSLSLKSFQAQRNLYPNDTLNLVFMGIDFDTYNFWQTLEYSRNSTGNPFASPTKVQSNVSNAIGIWGGYGSKNIIYIAK